MLLVGNALGTSLVRRKNVFDGVCCIVGDALGESLEKIWLGAELELGTTLGTSLADEPKPDDVLLGALFAAMLIGGVSVTNNDVGIENLVKGGPEISSVGAPVGKLLRAPSCIFVGGGDSTVGI